jgi:phage host-nuclease inhibitor protein Gam
MTTKTARIKQASVKYPVPQTHDQVVEAIAEMGRRQRERQRIQADMNDELARIKERHEEEARPHGEAIQAILDGVQTYCEAHRDELTGGGKIKSANLSSGEVGWRTSNPKVTVKSIEKALKDLKERFLIRFIRPKEEVNKEEILSARALAAAAGPDEKNEEILAAVEAMARLKEIRSIKIEQDETFWIKPFETDLEEVVS